MAALIKAAESFLKFGMLHQFCHQLLENYLGIGLVGGILLGCGDLFIGKGTAKVPEIVPIGIVLEQIFLRNENAQHFKILIHFR